MCKYNLTYSVRFVSIKLWCVLKLRNGSKFSRKYSLHLCYSLKLHACNWGIHWFFVVLKSDYYCDVYVSCSRYSVLDRGAAIFSESYCVNKWIGSTPRNTILQHSETPLLSSKLSLSWTIDVVAVWRINYKPLLHFLTLPMPLLRIQHYLSIFSGIWHQWLLVLLLNSNERNR